MLLHCFPLVSATLCHRCRHREAPWTQAKRVLPWGKDELARYASKKEVSPGKGMWSQQRAAHALHTDRHVHEPCAHHMHTCTNRVYRMYTYMHSTHAHMHPQTETNMRIGTQHIHTTHTHIYTHTTHMHKHHVHTIHNTCQAHAHNAHTHEYTSCVYSMHMHMHMSYTHVNTHKYMYMPIYTIHNA